MVGLKRIIFIALMVLLCIPVFAAVNEYDAAVAEIVESFAKVLGTNTTVAFISMDSDSEAFSKRLMSDVEMGLVNQDVVVVNRSNIDAMIKELEFQTSGLVDDDQAVSILFDRAFMALDSIRNNQTKHVAFFDKKIRDRMLLNQEISS